MKKKYLLEVTVFVCGAVVMILEIVGSRVVWPYFWSSVFIWTSLIGIILWSLSIWYWLGGMLADKKSDLSYLSLIIFGAALFVWVSVIYKEYILYFLQLNINDIKIASVIATIILFGPASILLWMVLPYVIKLKINNVNNSGWTVGNIYAISTIWSIVGTFLAGFYLIPTLGTTNILIMLTVVLILISIIIFSIHLLIQVLVLIIVSLYWILFNLKSIKYVENGFIDIDTQYSRIRIHESYENGKKVKRLSIDNSHSSVMYVNNDGLFFLYTKYFDLSKHFNPTFKKVVMIWGAAYSYPKHLLEKYKSATIDVVEIDPKLTYLAKKYFNHKDNSRMRIFHEDARIFVNKKREKYDVLIIDAFKSKYAIPYHLTTKEAIQKYYDILSDDWVVLINIISSIEGEKWEFLRAEYATYKSIFPQVYLFPIKEIKDNKYITNIILVALKSKEKPKFQSENNELNEYLKMLWKKPIITDMPILTDDYAPVDYYINKVLY